MRIISKFFLGFNIFKVILTYSRHETILNKTLDFLCKIL